MGRGNSCKLVIQETRTGKYEWKCKWKGQDLDDGRGETVASRSLRRASAGSMHEFNCARTKRKSGNTQTHQKVSRCKVSVSIEWLESSSHVGKYRNNNVWTRKLPPQVRKVKFNHSGQSGKKVFEYPSAIHRERGDDNYPCKLVPMPFFIPLKCGL
jgi:hypothetical protein